MPSTVTMKGQPLEMSGQPPRVGDAAPDFKLTASDMSTVTLADSAGKVRIISAVPSIDTGVCSTETKRFNQELESLPDNVIGYTVSIDTPFAQKRWCGAEGVERMKMLSTYRNNEFGLAYGIYLDKPGFLARCVFVIDSNDKVAYVQLVPEVGTEPDYQPVLEKARQLASGEYRRYRVSLRANNHPSG